MIDFYISYNIEENSIYISYDGIISVNVNIYEWDTTTNAKVIINSFGFINFSNNTFWFKVENNLYELNGILVEVLEKDNNIIKEEYIRFRNRYGELIKKQVLIIMNRTGIGDVLSSTPIIRKMFHIYNQRLLVFTYMPELFINSPYIESVIKLEHDTDIDGLISSNSEWSCYKIGKWDNFNYAFSDLRQISAWNLGFSLFEDELKMDFFPNSVKIDNLPERYICINPSITYTDRTWDVQNWQKFINLIEKHIPVVAIGRSLNYDLNCEKGFHNIEINNGINLLNKTSLSEAYHIIENSITFVTMSTGLHLLALCSDAHITELASPWNTKHFRVRNGIQDYKLEYLIGGCNIHCTSDLKISVNEYNTHLAPVHVHHNTFFSEDVRKAHSNRWWSHDKCYLNKDSYECHPTYVQVYVNVLKTISNL